MTTSNDIKALTNALQVFHIKMGNIKFDSVNPFFNSKYASLTQILDAIRDPLQESGLVIVQLPFEENGLTTMLIHAESGQFISTTYFMKPDKQTPQAYGSVITYQRRYCIQSILNLCFEEDDDANNAMPTTKQSKPVAKKEDDRQWLNKNTEMFNRAVEKLKSGDTTIDKIKLAFKLSKEVETLLINSINN